MVTPNEGNIPTQEEIESVADIGARKLFHKSLMELAVFLDSRGKPMTEGMLDALALVGAAEQNQSAATSSDTTE